MTSNAAWTIIISVGLASAFAAWVVTRDYYTKKITLLLKGIAKEREAGQHEIVNVTVRELGT